MKFYRIFGSISLFISAFVYSTMLLAQSKQATHAIPVQVGNVYRSVQLHIPAGHDGKTPLPLVFNLHGTGGTAESQELVTGMSAVSDAGQFLIVGGIAVHKFPSGRLAGRLTWNAVPDPEGVDDIDYIRAAIDAIDRKIPVDRKRVYATGFSGGARMSSRIACDLADEIAAVAPVAGIQFGDNCLTDRPIPIIAFHGTKDQSNRYDGAADPTVNVNWVAGVEYAVTSWARNNGCDSEAFAENVTEDVTQFSYRSCTDGADVVLYRIEDGGHTWPGSPTAESRPARAGITNMDIDASQLIWEFFKAHPLP